MAFTIIQFIPYWQASYNPLDLFVEVRRLFNYYVLLFVFTAFEAEVVVAFVDFH